jgi:hypothetical protein
MLLAYTEFAKHLKKLVLNLHVVLFLRLQVVLFVWVLDRPFFYFAALVLLEEMVA